jgi:hypothetical protein
MDKAKSIKTPMDTNDHLGLHMGSTSVDQKVYHSMKRWHDIMLSVCMCARFQAAPKDYHLRAVKRIMSYLVLTPNLVLWYPKGSHFELLGYSDVEYVGCKVDRKSNFGKLPISWAIPCLLIFKETKLHCPIHGRSGVCHRQ